MLANVMCSKSAGKAIVKVCVTGPKSCVGHPIPERDVC